MTPAELVAALIAREEMPPEKGDMGLQGVQGIQGEPGVPGLDGRDGRDGIDGKNGRDGTNGRDGRDGVDGASMRVGSGPPGSDAGLPGDVYLDVESGDIWRL